MSRGGAAFGPYILEHRLGVGGMAETFVAVRRGPAGFVQRVCLKRVLPALNADPTFAEQFVAEAKIAALLQHTNIVGVIDFGEYEGGYYLVLELVNGVDLRCLLTQLGGKLPVELAVLVAHDLARALAYAHEPRAPRPAIVHRDVSPSNLLLSVDGDVKLADFGIAKAIQTSHATASDMIKGKIQYMAPEQMLGRPIDTQADLFSLGVVLFQMLSGQRPFDGSSDAETMRRVIDDARPGLREVAPELPSELIELTEQLLSTSPSDRPSAGQVLDRLGTLSPKARRELASEVKAAQGMMQLALPHLLGPTIPMAPGGSAPQVRAPWSRSRRRALGALTGSLALGATVLTYAIAVGPRSTSPQPRAPGAMLEAPPEASREAELAYFRLDGAATSSPGVGTRAAATDSPQPLEGESVSPRLDEVDRTATRAAPSLGATEPVAPNAGASLVSAPVAEVAATRPAPREAHRRRAASAPQASTKSSLVHVIVVPWGEVWVDGRYMGRAPLDVAVAPGAHRFEVGQGKPSKVRRVLARASDQRVLEIELD